MNSFVIFDGLYVSVYHRINFAINFMSCLIIMPEKTYNSTWAYTFRIHCSFYFSASIHSKTENDLINSYFTLINVIIAMDCIRFITETNRN